ncbi:MAG: aminotransferase class V-fold PLP-dependent enzyme [Aquisalimonadaceae bacterium]
MKADARPLYLDYAATTPLDPRVLDAMLPWMRQDAGFGNPSSAGHVYGHEAAAAVEAARVRVAELVGADPAGVVFTSGATEANNLAILGAVRFAMDRGRGRHLISSRTEHSAVLEACARLTREGAEVTLLEPDAQGRVHPEQVAAALRDDTVLVSLMHVNNEIGVMQDIPTVADLLRDRATMLHVDAAQSAGRCPIRAAEWGVDLLSVSAHKLYGPKGIGALWVRPRPRLRLEPLMYGGGQEKGYRSGTLPVHQIVGMGEAFAVASAEYGADIPRLHALREQLCSGLQAAGALRINGDGELAPHILSVTFGCVHGESLALEMNALALSAGSACSSANPAPSHVLRAMGVPDSLALATFRFGLGRWTSAADVDQAVTIVRAALNRLRPLSPLWRRAQAGEDLAGLHGS